MTCLFSYTHIIIAKLTKWVVAIQSNCLAELCKENQKLCNFGLVLESHIQSLPLIHFKDDSKPDFEIVIVLTKYYIFVTQTQMQM